MANINGMRAALAEIESLKREAKRAMRRGEKIVADRIAADAAARAPGTLSAGISVVQDDNSTTVIGGNELAAYNEFGTGRFAKDYLASQPQNVQEEAYKFYVNGEGTIPQKPFFFPAIFEHQQEIVPTVEEELNKVFNGKS